jgi:hypothetical protein
VICQLLLQVESGRFGFSLHWYITMHSWLIRELGFSCGSALGILSGVLSMCIQKWTSHKSHPSLAYDSVPCAVLDKPVGGAYKIRIWKLILQIAAMVGTGLVRCCSVSLQPCIWINHGYNHSNVTVGRGCRRHHYHVVYCINGNCLVSRFTRVTWIEVMGSPIFPVFVNFEGVVLDIYSHLRLSNYLRF